MVELHYFDFDSLIAREMRCYRRITLDGSATI